MKTTSTFIDTLVSHVLLLAGAAAAVAGLALAATATAPAATGPAQGVTVSRSAIDGLRIGDPISRARREWGPADAKISRNGIASYRWRNADGMLAYVRARDGRIISIEVQGPVFRTGRGDGYGTKLAAFRRHWPSASRHADCCSAAVFHYAVRGAKPGTMLVFTFSRERGLQRVALMTEEHFRSCYLAECD